MHDDQKDLFEILVALVLNIFFLLLIALLLWPPGKATLVLSLAKGYGVLWVVLWAMATLVHRIQSWFRVNLYDRPNTFMISNLAVSCFLQAGWAAFAVLTIHRFVPGVPVWGLVLLYLAGVLSCLAAYFAVSAFYQGSLYRLVSLPLALVSFLVFSLWPAGGRAIFGWYFRLWGVG